ncbi:g170 [Coccomyxa elongata]
MNKKAPALLPIWQAYRTHIVPCLDILFADDARQLSSARSQSYDAGVHWQLQQARTKVTVKTTTKSQRFSLAIKPNREATIRQFWEEKRGVQDLACLHRFANFARIYPRYRDLDYLRVFMPQWDSAIDRIILHDRGMHPANELARKHPFVLNCKLEPLRWAKLAVRGRLPVYTWNTVLADLKRNTGAVQACITDTQSSTIKFKNPNKEWRAPHLLQDSKGQGVGETDSDGEADDRWLEAAEEARKQHE